MKNCGQCECTLSTACGFCVFSFRECNIFCFHLCREVAYDNGGVNGLLDAFNGLLFGSENRPIMYGANTNMPDLTTTSRLSMKDMQSYISLVPDHPLPGTSTPLAYIGSEGSSFNPHVEDRFFQSVNRHIAGALKVW